MGTEFQQRVWEEVGAIPYGAVRTYGEMARNLAVPDAVAAVEEAVRANPIALLIPGHRVVGPGGALLGDASDLERQQALLRLEGAWPVPLASER